MNVYCSTCNSVINRNPKEIRKYAKTFCQRSCLARYYSAMRTFATQIIPCLQCGTSVLKPKCAKGPTFCTAKCRLNWLKVPEERPKDECAYCQRPIDEYNNSRAFCSENCKEAYYSISHLVLYELSRRIGGRLPNKEIWEQFMLDKNAKKVTRLIQQWREEHRV